MEELNTTNKLELGKIATLPNLLSLSRLFLLPIILFFLATGNYYSATAFLLLSWITDALDGYIARRTNQVTNIGKILDHLVDKVSVGSIFVVLVLTKRFPFWLAGLIIARDTLIIIGSIILIRKRKFLYSSNILGKLAGFFFALLMLVYILEIKPLVIKDLITIITCILIAASFFYYLSMYLLALRSQPKERL
ncbi:MAG: CDP-alcohol phosphatidyltransferase family protein [candidate division WOR-3 bacterium]